MNSVQFHESKPHRKISCSVHVFCMHTLGIGGLITWSMRIKNLYINVHFFTMKTSCLLKCQDELHLQCLKKSK